MITANTLSRKYGDVVAVNGVSFEIKPGEIVGLLGHNGAGKTTIMKMMTGYLEPSGGSISINGSDVWSFREAIQRQVGYLPENCPLYPEMTVLDYLDYAAALRGVPGEQRLDRIAYVIGKTSLIAVAEKSISTLSRGYRQRLGVAQAILNSPNILILDEPTNGLDPSQIFEMRALIKELAESATIVVSTHILQEVQAVCSRVIIINGGKVALDAAMSNLQATGNLRIATNSNPDNCSKILDLIPGLKIVHSEKQKDDLYSYTVAPESEDLSATAATIIRLLVEHDCDVYELRPIMQDLETIFSEIKAGKVPYIKGLSSIHSELNGGKGESSEENDIESTAISAVASQSSDASSDRQPNSATLQDVISNE